MTGSLEAGVHTRSPGIRLLRCRLSDNQYGVLYDTAVSTSDIQRLHVGLVPSLTLPLKESSAEPISSGWNHIRTRHQLPSSSGVVHFINMRPGSSFEKVNTGVLYRMRSHCSIHVLSLRTRASIIPPEWWLSSTHFYVCGCENGIMFSFNISSPSIPGLISPLVTALPAPQPRQSLFVTTYSPLIATWEGSHFDYNSVRDWL